MSGPAADDLRALLDKQEITELMHLRARAADRVDQELALACYHDGATETHGTYEGPADQFVRRFSTRFGGGDFVRMNHHISNLLIELDGDTAAVESYYLCELTMKHGGAEHDVLIGGRYLDRLERRDRRWRISHRDCIYDWSRMDPSSERYWDRQYGGDRVKLLFGVAGADDPLYARLHARRGLQSGGGTT